MKFKKWLSNYIIVAFLLKNKMNKLYNPNIYIYELE